eukprot:scaffold675440_cov81-Prasinocladus_malaysianus.AAC.1
MIAASLAQSFRDTARSISAELWPLQYEYEYEYWYDVCYQNSSTRTVLVPQRSGFERTPDSGPGHCPYSIPGKGSTRYRIASLVVRTGYGYPAACELDRTVLVPVRKLYAYRSL